MIATIFSVSVITEEMIKTVRSFNHPFEFDIPKPETIQVSIAASSKPMYIAGRQLPSTITLYNENDTLLFKLKYFNEIISINIEESSWE